MTLATPVNELKFYYHVSDLIGNNYSPQAKALNIKSINEMSKANESLIKNRSFIREVSQSVPDFLFSSPTHVNRPNSGLKEHVSNKSVKLPPISDSKQLEETEGSILSHNITNNTSNDHYENSQLGSTSILHGSTPNKPKPTTKRINYASTLLDDENETDITSLKSFGSRFNFSNSILPSHSVKSYGAPTSVSTNPAQKYKIKRSQSLIYNDTDSMLESKLNGFDTIEEHHNESETVKERHNRHE